MEDAVGAGGLRNTLPGQMTLMGGLRVSIVLTCTELVWVRSSIGLTPEEMKKVSCMSLAG